MPYQTAVHFFQEGKQNIFFNYRKGLSETLLGHEITPCASYYLKCACMQAHLCSPSRGRKLNSSESTIWQSNFSGRQYIELTMQLTAFIYCIGKSIELEKIIITMKKAQGNKYSVNLFKQSLLFPGGTGSLANKHSIFPTPIFCDSKLKCVFILESRNFTSTETIPLMQ